MIKTRHNTDSEDELTIELYSNLSMSLDRFFAVFLVISAVTLLSNWVREIIHFDAETVTIRHLAASKSWRVQWPVTWLRLARSADRQGRVRLYLSQHGQKQEIGGFLPSHERDELSGLIKTALTQRTGWVSQVNQEMAGT
jgi:uncharacterized membrane protein